MNHTSLAAMTVCCLLAGSATSSEAATTRHRMIILADMLNEPDELQQNIHLLMYSNEVDIEGLIAVTGFWLQDAVHPEAYQDLVNGYESVYGNLQLHATGWPTPAYLRSVIGEGYPDFGMNGVGSGKSTSGSELIIAALNKNDPRPITIVVNAGANCLAQALTDYESRYSTQQLSTAIGKLLVYENGSQDDAGAWIAHRYPAIHFIRSNWQTYAYMGRSDNVPGSSNNPNPSSDGPYTWQPYPRGSVAGGDIGIGQKTWSHVHIRDNHGALGARYPDRTAEGQFLEGGGISPWIGLVNHGLYDPAPGHESWGGWGGRFTKDKIQNYWSRFQQIKPTEQSQDTPFWMYADQVTDRWVNPEDGETFNDINCGVYRWRRAILDDFRGRMDWCTKARNQANHNPRAVFNGDKADTIIMVTAAPGQALSLNASASSDTDGNSLKYKWFIYPEAGTYTGTISIPNDTNPQTTVTIPANANGKQIHLILQVRDIGNVTDESGVLSMYDYRRIVIAVGATGIGKDAMTKIRDSKGTAAFFTVADHIVLPPRFNGRGCLLSAYSLDGKCLKKSLTRKNAITLPPGPCFIRIESIQ